MPTPAPSFEKPRDRRPSLRNSRSGESAIAAEGFMNNVG